MCSGEKGLLWVKGDNVMLGYYNDKKATQKVLQDGWLCTGDLAYFDSDGKIIICGREKDLIIHKGLNIYPPEIENLLINNLNVLSCAIVGMPDVESGEIPVAFVSLKDENIDAKRVEPQLRKLCLESLASYKIPRKFIFLDELPMTALRKVDKKILKKQYLEKDDE